MPDDTGPISPELFGQFDENPLLRPDVRLCLTDAFDYAARISKIGIVEIKTNPTLYVALRQKLRRALTALDSLGFSSLRDILVEGNRLAERLILVCDKDPEKLREALTLPLPSDLERYPADPSPNDMNEQPRVSFGCSPEERSRICAAILESDEDPTSI